MADPDPGAAQDPYRWLEEDSARTREWIRLQNERTERALGHVDARDERRLRELLGTGSIGQLALGGDRLFFLLRHSGQEQSVLHVTEGPGTAPRVLLDPLELGERAAIDWLFPSPRGRYLALGVSHDGDERSTLHLLDVARARELERIDGTQWAQVSWLHDERGFYYTRYPIAGEALQGADDAGDAAGYRRRVFFHRLGAEPLDDALVWQGERTTDFPWPVVSTDDRYVLIHNLRGWTANDLYLFDRGAHAGARHDAPEHPGAVRTIIRGRDQRSSGTVLGDGWLYLLTNEGAPRNRIVRVHVERAHDLDAWQDVVAESQGILQDWVAGENLIAAHYLHEVRSRLVTFDLEGNPMGEAQLPAEGSIRHLSASESSDRVAFVFSSLLHPPTLFVCNAGGHCERVLQVEHAIDSDAYELSRGSARSRDGTPINVYYVHRRDLRRNRDNRVLLYGYGGFNTPLLPSFSPHVLYWLEQGGVFALANVRGGGELGESWHRAGMLKNKHRVFEDFEAAIRWFSDQDISRPAKIGIYGASNGGLLVGAVLTRAPQAIGAAVAQVGLYDMLRYHRFPPAALWISEYGDPEDPETAEYLQSYSPYHRVREGTEYPAVLIETADRDTRVFWGHSTKFAARLQASGPSKPVYFYMQRRVGHGAGTRLSDELNRYLRMYAFLTRALATLTPPLVDK